MSLITVYDAMGANVDKLILPPGVKMAGYLTGSGGVPWTPAQWAKYPDAIRIDQSPVNTAPNELADVLDVEQDAATLEDVPGWVLAAQRNYRNAVRPGQRSPVIYMSASNVTPVVNTLVAEMITSGVGLWIAGEMTFDQAAAMVTNASGPYPVKGVQYAFLGDHDVSVFNAEWFNTVSVKTPVKAPVSGVQGGWKWCYKCQGMFYGPHGNSGVCPRGGEHDGTGSYSYEIGFRN